MKPSATRANPEYAFRTVITTATKVSKHPIYKEVDLRISAPPMAAVVVYPFKKLRTAFPARQHAAMIGDPGAMTRNVPIVAALRPRREELSAWRGPGSLMGLDDIRPASFRKATTDPVKVTPPMRTPRYPATRCRVEMSPI
tara:strand:+ start:432 stop:854 length:423 start_codon:yes stop_codon:yes gene_type:complete